jgi:hypothetical protein
LTLRACRGAIFESLRTSTSMAKTRLRRSTYRLFQTHARGDESSGGGLLVSGLVVLFVATQNWLQYDMLHGGRFVIGALVAIGGVVMLVKKTPTS